MINLRKKKVVHLSNVERVRSLAFVCVTALCPSSFLWAGVYRVYIASPERYRRGVEALAPGRWRDVFLYFGLCNFVPLITRLRKNTYIISPTQIVCIFVKEKKEDESGSQLDQQSRTTGSWPRNKRMLPFAEKGVPFGRLSAKESCR